MNPSRHRRRVTSLRAAALSALPAAGALAVAAVAADTRAGLRLAVAAGALSTAAVSGLLLASERRLPAAVGAERARQATGFAAAQRRIAADQRAALGALAGRLEQARAANRRLEATVADLRRALASERTRRATDVTIAELWPDLGEPSVGDLVAWDSRSGLAGDGAVRRSA